MATAVVATVLAAVWALMVPMFQGPDEDQHLDYAMSIYGAGHLITIRELPFLRDRGFPFPERTNPLVAYLEDRTGYDTSRRSPAVPAPPGYGTTAFYDAINAGAPPPRPQTLGPLDVATSYYGYVFYGLVALVLSGVHLFTDRATDLFFAARFVAVAMVAPSVVVGYRVLRMLGWRPIRASLVVLAFAIFPTTTFMCSYVQPESLAMLGWLASIYAGLSWRNRPRSIAWALALGVCGSALTATKPQYGLVAAVPVGAAVLTNWIRADIGWQRRVCQVGCLAVPAAAFGLTKLWMNRGPIRILPAEDPVIDQILLPGLSNLGGPQFAIHQAISRLGPALVNHFVIGNGLISFWGFFGWQDAPLFPGQPWAWAALGAVTFLTFALGVAALLRNGIRLLRLALRRGLGGAFRVFANNPLINGYLMFTVFTIAYLDVRGGGETQGRYWVPVLLGGIAFAVGVAPRALGHRWRLPLSNLILFGWVAFSIVASIQALEVIHARYYNNGREITARTLPSGPALAGGDARIEYFTQTDKAFFRRDQIRVPIGGDVAVVGWAHLPNQVRPESLFIVIDGTVIHQAVYGDRIFGRTQADGFDAFFSVVGLDSGVHQMAVRIVPAGGGGFYEPGPPLKFAVVPDPKKRYLEPDELIRPGAG